MNNPSVLAWPLIASAYFAKVLRSARQALEQNNDAEAVIWAITACEVLTEQSIDAAFRSKNLVDLGKAVGNMVPSYNLANDRVRAVYQALTADTLTNEGWWPDFKALSDLRNGIIHGDVRRVPPESARRGCEAASELIAHLIKRTYGVDPTDYGPSPELA